MCLFPRATLHSDSEQEDRMEPQSMISQEPVCSN
jgi:hypothetical protein